MSLYLLLEIRAWLLLESLIHRQPFHEAQSHFLAEAVVAWTVLCKGLLPEGQLVNLCYLVVVPTYKVRRQIF